MALVCYNAMIPSLGGGVLGYLGSCRRFSINRMQEAYSFILSESPGLRCLLGHMRAPRTAVIALGFPRERGGFTHNRRVGFS